MQNNVLTVDILNINNDDRLNDAFDKLSELLQQNSNIIGNALAVIHQLFRIVKLTEDKATDTMGSVDVETAAEGQDEVIDKRSKNCDRKVTVEIKLVFLKIMKINTIEEYFTAEIYLQAKWEEPSLDCMTEKDVTDINFEKFWNPCLTILNMEEELSSGKKIYSVKLCEPGYDHPLVVLSWRFKAMFKEAMELQHFPFDVQDLTVSITSERSVDEVTLTADRRNLSTVNVQSFHGASGWGIYEHAESFQDQTASDYEGVIIHPILHISCRVKRQIGYFLWNIVLIMLLIALLSFTLAVIDAALTDRMALNITLFLTAVAFKVASSTDLPSISYLTYLDKYVLATLTFLGLMIGENCLLFELSTTGKLKNYVYWDKLCLGILGAIHFSFHIGFFVYIYITAFGIRRRMAKIDYLYQKRKECLSQYGIVASFEDLLE